MYEDSWCSSIYFFSLFVWSKRLKVFFLHQFLLRTFLETTRGDFLLTSIPVSTSGDAFRHTTTVNVHQIMFGDFHMINWISNVMLIYSNSASFDPTFERKCETIFLINASFDCLSLVLVLQHQPHLMSCPLQSKGCHPQKNSLYLAESEAGVYFFLLLSSIFTYRSCYKC